MSERIVRAAMTETRNAYPGMPGSVDKLDSLTGKMDEVRVANVEHNVALIESAVRQGAQVICLGELFSGPYFALERNPLWFDLAESADDGPTVERLREVAKRQQVVIVAPIYEQLADGRRFNTAVIIDADGSHLGKFRKVHIPQGANEQGEFVEQFYYERSDGDLGNRGTHGDRLFPVFETRVGRLGVAICYDRHFAVSMQTLADAGAELVFSPAVTFGAKSREMWQHEFPTDACRYRIFIGGSNRRGIEPPWEIEYFGESYFVGPDGRADNVSDHEELVIADLDLGSLAGPDPSGWNFRRDRR